MLRSMLSSLICGLSHVSCFLWRVEQACNRESLPRIGLWVSRLDFTVASLQGRILTRLRHQVTPRMKPDTRST